MSYKIYYTKGATRTVRSTSRDKIRLPFRVEFNGKWHGDYKSKEQAQRAINAHKRKLAEDKAEDLKLERLMAAEYEL